MQHDAEGYLVIAAIKFGTTYSRYAFSFKDKPGQIHINREWEDEDGLFKTSKVPTSILFDKTGKFDSFGYEAESKYRELSSNKEETGWRFFKHFKMSLCRELAYDEHGEDVNVEQMYERRPSSNVTKSVWYFGIKYVFLILLYVIHLTSSCGIVSFQECGILSLACVTLTFQMACVRDLCSPIKKQSNYCTFN